MVKMTSENTLISRLNESSMCGRACVLCVCVCLALVKQLRDRDEDAPLLTQLILTVKMTSENTLISRLNESPMCGCAYVGPYFIELLLTYILLISQTF